MKTATLDELCEINVGRTPARAEPSYWGPGHSWLSIADMNQGLAITRTKEQITEAGAEAGRIVKPGTVLVSFKLSIGKVGITEIPLYTNEAIAALPVRNKNVLEPRYLMRALQAMDLASGANHAAMGATLNKGSLAQIRVPLPDIAEQLRIAAILDHADALRAKRRQVLTQLDALTPSIFREMFGDPARNPLGFPLATIRSLAEKFSDGPFGSNLKSSHYVDAGVPVVRLQNIGVGRYLDHDRAFVSEEHYATLSKHDCRPGDILIGTLGDPNLRACIQPDFLSRALNKADCIQFRTDPRVADPVWACWLLNEPGTLSLAASLAHGQTRTRIAMGQLRELKVPVPPLDLQHEFAVRVAAVSASRARTVDASATDDRLFASLQARAFRGEL